MKIFSDAFRIEATYDELLFMYEGMMKAFDEMPDKFDDYGCFKEEAQRKDEQLFELSITLGKKDEFLKKRHEDANSITIKE